MAKNKKSKILASMLAVSTMAVFYAAPVMAGDANIDATQGQGITINVAVDGDPDAGGNGLYTQGPAGLIDYHVHGQLTITSANLVTALEGQTFNDLTINNLDTTNLTVNGETVDLSQLADVDLSNVKGITRSAGATTPGTVTTTIEGVLSVDGTTHEIYNAGNTFNVDDSGNVDAASFHATTGDVSTTRYSLNTVGADLDTVEQRTQKITYVQSVDTTNISGRVIASGVTLNNGNISTNGTLVAKEVANASGDTLSGVAGDVDDLTLSVASVSELTQNIDADRTTAGITTFKGDVNVDGNVKAATADFGQMTLNGQRVLAANHVLTVGDETLNFRKANQTIENTAGIERESGVDFAGRPLDTTTIEGKTTIDSLGRLNTDTVIAIQGQFGDVMVIGDSLRNVGDINGAEVSGSNGALTISGVELNNGLVDGVDVSELSSAATDISGLVKKTAGIDKVGAVTTVEGVSFAQGRMDADYVLTDGLKVNGLSDLDGVKVQNGSVYAENDSYVGGVQLADGNVTATEVTAGGYKLTDIGKNTQDIKYNNGVTTIGGETLAVTDEGYVTINNGAFAIGLDGMATVGNNIQLDGETGVVSANDLKATNNVYSKHYNLEEVGADLANLGADVGNIGGNVAGISRNDGDLPYGQGVTSIEGVVSVDGQSGLVNFSTGNGNGVLINSSQGQVIANSVGANQIVGENLSGGNGAFRVSENGDILMQNGSGESISMTDGGLNLMSTDNGTGMVTLRDGSVSLMGNGTSTVTVDENGTTFGTMLGSETTNINGGTVTASGDFVTVDENGETKYTLNTIGDNTQAIKYQDGVTTIGGETLAVTDEGYVTINNGAFAVGPDGMVAVGNSIQFDGETGVVYANDLKATNNVYSKNYNLEEVGDNLDDLTGSVGNIGDNVAGIRRDAAEGAAYGEGVTSIEGSTSFDANGMVVGDNAIVANTDGSFSAGNGSFKVSDGVTTIGGETLAVTDEGYVTINNGAFSVGPDGMVAVGNSIQLDGETGVVYANDLKATNNVYSKNYNLEEVGADLKKLSGDFTTTNANVAGIERIGEGAPGEGITTIEGDALFVSKNVTYMSSGDAMIQTSTDSAYMSFGDNMISINKGGINLTGSVGFTGHDGGRYTLSDLEGRVYDLEQKTQNITSADPGQGGGSEVPPTGDGHTGFEGDVTVGDNVTVGGDANIDGNANVSGNVNVDGQINVGSTVVDKNGITAENGTFTNVNVGGENGTSINHDEVRVGGADGSYMNENDVVTGEGNSLNDTANRVGNLEQGVSELNNRVGELEDRIDKVGAMAAAIANLRTMGYDPAAPTEVAVGIGQYRDETGAALGLFHYPNRDFMLSLSVSSSGDEVMGGIGATWKFGRKSPEKVAEIKKAQAEADARRAEEAKLAKAEEMKQAAKEAKIKAQQERHAKLAAERAAQAEAAK